MKAISALLIPLVVVLVSACASGPGGPVYVDGGPGPDGPRDGYYWNGVVYVQGEPPPRAGYYWNGGAYYPGEGGDHRDYSDSRSTTNVTDVNVNRTNVNENTVNRSDVKSQGNVKESGSHKPKTKTTRKPVHKEENNQQGDQQQQPSH